ncbi:TIGR02171 family protein [Fibrobacter succinogenes]|uniref:TIGR02171 family lipoprotein n=1 Tax=Fibrobacter succinogenes TaxID=833 RepID=UPI0026F2C84B|nr:TIGR02171 family protein [Fibrobacter succinogenes]
MRYFEFLLLIVALLNACSDDSGSHATENPVEHEDIEGFVFVNAHGNSAYLGTNASNARQNEKPQMSVLFSYDFYIGEHEVSCGEYKALRKDVNVQCENGDNRPVTNVTFYDAVLYANAKSKQNLLDTVYTYTSASFDASGSCDNLKGLVFHENVNGYRLPTEAEWVYVASHDWNPEKGWNSNNSGSNTHDVATSPANGIGVYDMAGNVLEWVNDWLTPFITASPYIMDFVGGADEGSLGERVVKGGSYRNEPSVIDMYSRGDVYTVVSSTKGDYLGFRLALGAIPKPTWLDECGAVKESIVKSQVDVYEMKHVVGTFESKLVFRNDFLGNLSFIDFGSGVVSVVDIKGTQKAYHPDISPDGKRVAYCSGIEGNKSDASSIYVRDLNAEGSNLVELDVKGAAIPRWRVLDNGDTVIVYVTNPGNNKDDAAFKSTSTWQVKFANGKFGKPEKLFDGAYHGGVNASNTLAVTGARILRARIAPKGKTLANGIDTVWYGGEQACNASLANDGSDRTLFLDFGGKTGAKFVGQSYRTHERLLVVDAKGNLI